MPNLIKRDHIVALGRLGKTVAQIATIVGTTKGYVRTCLYAAKIRVGSRPDKNPIKHDLAAMEALYAEHGTMIRAGAAVGVSGPGFCKALNRARRNAQKEKQL